MNSCHLDLGDAQWFMDSFFHQKMSGKSFDQIMDAIEFHPFVRTQSQFDAADSMENLILKIASIVLLRAFHYKKFINVDVVTRVSPFCEQLQKLWATRQMQTEEQRFITTWRAFYILNYSKALIDNQSKYLEDFSADYTKFSKLNRSDFYKLDEVDYAQNPQKYIFSDPFIKKSYEEVLAVKKDFFKFMDSILVFVYLCRISFLM